MEPNESGAGGKDDSSDQSSSQGGSSTLTPIPPPPPLQFDLDGDDVPSRADLKRWYKASEDEKYFLERRVRKLQQDEIKAIKKIIETEERAKRIEEQRRRNEEYRTEKQQLKEASLKAQAKEHEIVALNKSRDRGAISSARTRVELERKERVRSVRRERAIHQLLVNTETEMRLERLRQQRKAIKEASQEWKVPKSPRAEERKLEVKKELEALRDERAKNVQDSARLVVQEAALLHKLCQLRQRNAAALSHLSTVVSTPCNSPRVDEDRTTLPEINSSRRSTA